MTTLDEMTMAMKVQALEAEVARLTRGLEEVQAMAGGLGCGNCEAEQNKARAVETEAVRALRLEKAKVANLRDALATIERWLPDDGGNMRSIARAALEATK